MKTLVTGGAGYIGSHVVHELLHNDYGVVVVDDLSTGISSRLSGVPQYQIDLSEEKAISTLKKLIIDFEVDSVVHLAAKKDVAESFDRPDYYFSQNVGGVKNLIKALQGTKVSSFVFSSTAAVYGDAGKVVLENTPTSPSSPYGQSKLEGERLLEAASFSQGLKVCILRYFNVAGANPGFIPDSTAKNLIPMVLERVVDGRQPEIFGTDYNTRDGSCVRDFVHPRDIANAHVKAIEFLETSSENFSIFNLGSGVGYSVKEVVEVAIDKSSYKGEVRVMERRTGDVPEICADISKARQHMKWAPTISLEEIIQSQLDLINK